MGYDIQYQVIGTGVWNTWSVTANRYDTSDVLEGWVIEFMVRASNGDTVKSDVSIINPHSATLFDTRSSQIFHLRLSLQSVESSLQFLLIFFTYEILPMNTSGRT